MLEPAPLPPEEPPLLPVELPEGDELLLLEVLEVPAGVEDVPAGVVEVPAGVVEVPAGVVDVPAGVVEDPAGVEPPPTTEEDPPEEAPLKHEVSVPAWTGKGADCWELPLASRMSKLRLLPP